ncbi:MAG: O-methyltransferase, partial [Lachnospiraceae bacterium]|nr:O-methyltransferase [Lachnospiraceae bacterium]
RSLLRVLLTVKKPERILEVGTAIGFSAVLMAECAKDAHIDTIENWQPRIEQAEINIQRSGFADRIELLKGDAGEIIKQLEGPYDLIFLDAAKAQYINYLDDLKRLLPAGGLLISDNVLQEGDLVESHYAVMRRNRTIYKRMREYLYAITHDDELETVITPLGDGISVTVKK